MTLVGDVAQSTAPAGRSGGPTCSPTSSPAAGAARRRSPSSRSATACRSRSCPSPTGCCRSRASTPTPAAACGRGSCPVVDHVRPAALADDGRDGGEGEAPPPPHGRRRTGRAPRGSSPRRSSRPGWTPSITCTSCTRRGAAVRARAGEGPRVRRRGRGRARRDPRWHVSARRLLYVAMTRAVQELAFVTTSAGRTPAIA